MILSELIDTISTLTNHTDDVCRFGRSFFSSNCHKTSENDNKDKKLVCDVVWYLKHCRAAAVYQNSSFTNSFTMIFIFFMTFSVSSRLHVGVEPDDVVL